MDTLREGVVDSSPWVQAVSNNSITVEMMQYKAGSEMNMQLLPGSCGTHSWTSYSETVRLQGLLVGTSVSSPAELPATSQFHLPGMSGRSLRITAAQVIKSSSALESP